MSASPPPLEVFVSYAPEDEALRIELEKHLALLQHQGHITSFHAGKVSAGSDWKAALDAHLDRARVVLLLVSADFIASRRCYEAEMTPALARHARGEARVIPVLLRACDLQDVPFRGLASLPANGTPVTSWPNRDEALRDVAQGVREAMEALRPAERPAPDGGLAREVPDGGLTREGLVRHILQRLADPTCRGVAILEPFGFGADRVANAVLAALVRPAEPLLPVRLVPEVQSTTDERLYGKLLRDLRRALPEDPAWRKLVDDRREASAKERFEYAVEDLLDGPVQAVKRKLLFVVEGLAHVPEARLVEWGMLLQRLSDRGLKLLVWGSQELYDLRTRPPSGGLYSAFHVLREVRLGPLSVEAVERAIEGQAGEAAARRVAAIVHEVTGGHPALVAEMIQRYPEEVAAGNRDRIARRILEGEHMTRLRRAVERDAELKEILRGFAGAGQRPMARGRRRGEERLMWLGVLRDAGPGRWDWAAPVMQGFAGEWV